MNGRIKPIIAVAAMATACLAAQNCLAQASGPSNDQIAQKVADDLKFETSDFMLHSAYRNVTKLDNKDAPDGAYDKNQEWEQTHTGRWYIEFQRFGGDLIDGGVATNNQDAIKRGLNILQWGFNQEGADGGFDCKDAFHSASFFVESSAHALLLIEGAGMDGPYKSQIDGMKSKLDKAAHWFMEPANKSTGLAGDAPFTHRNYLLAAALGETGVLCGDQDLTNEAVGYAKAGIARQDPSGYNPEKGGYDSSYHAVGLWYASRYYTIACPPDLKAPMRNMLKKATEWEASRILPDGQVTTEGNSRVGGANGEHDRSGSGTAKKPAVGEVFRCFEYWAIISGDRSYTDLAEKVAKSYHMYKGE